MMPTWLIYHFASGTAYFTGAAMLGLGAGLSFVGRRAVRVSAHIVGGVGVVFVILSATPSPLWLYAIWGATVLSWLIVGTMPRLRRSTLAIATRLSMLAACAGAAGAEARYHVVPSLGPPLHDSLYVLGDSISAGIGSPDDRTWPQILGDRHGITVVNLARAGATTPDTLGFADHVEAQRAVLLIEIGGNDLLAGVPADEFETSLRLLLAELDGSERALVMCELPLPPFHNDYGKAQRRLATEFGVTLIPKRMFASVVSASGATIDGLHLSQSGHERMAEVVWTVVGRGFRLR